MKSKILWGILLLLGLSLGTHFAAAQDDEREFFTVQIEHNGDTRQYLVYEPSTLPTDAAHPAVIVFHGAGGSGGSIARLTGFNDYAEADGVLMVYPIGPLGYWDYGAGTAEWEGIARVFDDPDFMRLVLDDIQSNYNISSLSVVGFSNGARMAWRMACDFGDQLDAVVGVSATISTEVLNICPAERQISVLYMHGTDDPTTPWNGDTLTIDGRVVSIAWSAPNTVNYWVEQNGCTPEPTITDVEDLNTEDSITQTRVLFDDCDAEYTVEFIAVLGGGHGWLGGEYALNPEGYQASGYASDYIWDFFGFGEE